MKIKLNYLIILDTAKRLMAFYTIMLTISHYKMRMVVFGKKRISSVRWFKQIGLI